MHIRSAPALGRNRPTPSKSSNIPTRPLAPPRSRWSSTASTVRPQSRAAPAAVNCDGTSNPGGVDCALGDTAYGSAGVTDRFFHMACGGLDVRQGGTPANPYSDELLPSIVDHKHYRAAYAGVDIYQGRQYPPE